MHSLAKYLAGFIIFCISLCSNASFAQQWLSIKIGPGLSNYYGASYLITKDRKPVYLPPLLGDSKFRAGLCLTISYDRFLKDNLALGAGLQYVQRGWTERAIDKATYSESGSLDYRYHYIAIPLKVSFKGDGDQLFMSWSSGLCPSVLMRAKAEGVPAPDGSTTLLTEEARSIDLLATTDAALNYTVNDNILLNMSLGYMLSFLSFSEKYKAKHYGFSLQLGISYVVD